jgi:hypothetical protein
VIESDDYAYLPPTLAEIARVAGLPAALQLMHTHGGVRVGIPKRAPDGHWLVELVGREAADRLGAHFAGGRVLIPLGEKGYLSRRRRLAAERLAEGQSLDAVALATDMHVRTVSRVKARLRSSNRGDQGDLF